MAESDESTRAVQDNNNPNKLRSAFIALSESLLENVCDVFPECLNTQSVLQLFRQILKGNVDLEDKFIRKCSSVFKENAEALRDKEPEGLFTVTESIDHLKEINLREKWEDPDFTAESKDHLWQYIYKLKNLSDIYNAVPSKVLGAVEQTAGNFVEQLSQGKLDLANLDLNKLGEDMLSHMSDEDMAKFESELPEIFQALTEAMGTPGGSQGGPGLDIGSIFRQMAMQCGEGKDTNSGFDLSNLQSLLQAPNSQTGETININQMMQALTPILQSIQNDDGQRAKNPPKKQKAKQIRDKRK